MLILLGLLGVKCGAAACSQKLYSPTYYIVGLGRVRTVIIAVRRSTLCGVADDGTITWVKPLTGRVPYAKLPPRSKFALNSCRSTNGVKDEAGCDTNKQPAGWDSYRNLMYTAGCNSDQCLCKGGELLAALELPGPSWFRVLQLPTDHERLQLDRVQRFTRKLLQLL